MYRADTQKVCQSVLLFQSHFSAPFNPNNTSDSPHGVCLLSQRANASTPAKTFVPTICVRSPCGSSSPTVLWLFLGKLFSGLPPQPGYANTAREMKTELVKNRKKHWLDYGWVCGSDCMCVWGHSPMWFHLDSGWEPHRCSSHPVSSLIGREANGGGARTTYPPPPPLLTKCL